MTFAEEVHLVLGLRDPAAVAELEAIIALRKASAATK